MRLVIVDKQMGQYAADLVIKRWREKKTEEGRPFVLGLPTGETPVPLYEALISHVQKGTFSFKNIVTFNMDEYWGLAPDHPQSYHAYMHRTLFDHIDISVENINLLNGLATDGSAECAQFEQKIAAIGGIDLFLGGMGVDGHLAFNEAGSSLASRARVVTLAQSTILANARFFNDNHSHVPTQALTVGVGTVMDAREVLLMAKGGGKARAVKAAVEGSVSQLWPVSALQLHPAASLLADEAACGELMLKTVRHYQELEQREPLANISAAA